MIENLGLKLGNVITPQNITANIVEKYIDDLQGAIGSNIETLRRIFTGEKEHVEAVEFQVNHKAKCLDTPLQLLKLKKGILIGCISRGADIIIPSGKDSIKIEDSVIIITKNEKVHNIDDILVN
jgi:trk system potassium uptake protein TrkA